MLPKQYRLQKDKDFKRVFLKGKFFDGRILSLKPIENSLEFSRFGFIVGLKISKKATLRSQIKRKLRESIRAKLDKIKSGFDIVIITKPEIVGKGHKEIDKEIERLLRKAKLEIEIL